MSSDSSFTPVLVIAAAAAVAGAGIYAIIDYATAEDVYYTCVTDDGEVVDQNYCDVYNGTGGYYFFSSNTYYAPGTRAPSGWHNTRFRPNDVAARQKYGLPKTGKIPTKVSVGGFGKGGTSSGGG